MSEDLKYVTNAEGVRVAVILPIEDFENLLEDRHVLRIAYETRNEPTFPLADVIEELRAEGKID